MNYFLVKVKYEKMLDEGKVKKVTTQLLIDALSFSESENTAIEEMKPYISGEFKVAGMMPKKIDEIIGLDNDGSTFYQLKLNYIEMSESGEERHIPSTLLVRADGIEDAYAHFKEAFKGSMAYYRVVSIAETKITEVILYNLKENK